MEKLEILELLQRLSGSMPLGDAMALADRLSAKPEPMKVMDWARENVSDLLTGDQPRRITAIKEVRNAFGIGLQEAKSIVDALQAELAPEPFPV